MEKCTLHRNKTRQDKKGRKKVFTFLRDTLRIRDGIRDTLSWAWTLLYSISLLYYLHFDFIFGLFDPSAS